MFVVLRNCLKHNRSTESHPKRSILNGCSVSRRPKKGGIPSIFDKRGAKISVDHAKEIAHTKVSTSLKLHQAHLIYWWWV